MMARAAKSGDTGISDPRALLAMVAEGGKCRLHALWERLVDTRDV